MKFAKLIFGLLSLVLFSGQIAISPPDPYLLTEYNVGGSLFYGNRDTSAMSPRGRPVINPAQKTIVLITAGQSNIVDVQPTLYTPVHTSAVINFNIYDGAGYGITGPMLGCQFFGGPGNITARLADMIINNGKADVVIAVPTAIAGTLVSDWATGNLSTPGIGGRLGVVIRRLAAAGITPSTPGVKFALLWAQGESDNVGGTSSASYQASFNTMKAGLIAAGFSGPIFINLETWDGGVTSTTIRAAQTALVDNSVTFVGGDWDTLGAPDRAADNTHINDTGASLAATLVYNAMLASGAIF